MGKKIGNWDRKTNCKGEISDQRFGAWEINQNIPKLFEKLEGQSFNLSRQQEMGLYCRKNEIRSGHPL